MNDSKGKNFMSNTTNLRGSNCFKALIENRNRSPNKLEGSNSKQLNKKDGLSLLKESASSNNMLEILEDKANLNSWRVDLLII